MTLLASMVTALLLTLLLEIPFAYLWGVRKNGLILVILMNLLTNPVANLLWALAWQIGWATNWFILGLELGVVTVEGFCCRGIIKHPWPFALLINLFSYALGVWIQLIV